MGIQNLIQAIHDSPTQLVFVAAGAGTGALSHLLAVVGASRTLLEALIPYSQSSFDDFLGQRPQQYVAGKTARLLAGRALTRARLLRARDDIPVVGLACTATIATDRPKRGEHRAHIALWQAERLVEYSVQLAKGARTRAGEEELVSRVMLNALAAACGVEMTLELALGPGDDLATTVYDFADAADKLIQGEARYFALNEHGCIQSGDAQTGVTLPPLLLSGSFNPLHEGHLEMVRAATQMLDRPGAFELSATNVDKAPLPSAVILDRISQFAGRYPIYVSSAPTFVEKARLFPQTTFIIGHDTAVRLFEPKYYNDSAQQMIAALRELQEQGCHFLVAGRADKQGRFFTLDDIAVPAEFQDLLRAIPQELFRNDTSSTELRARGRQGSR